MIKSGCQNVSKVIIETNFGNITFELFPNIAPETVRNFVKLAKSNFYDGTLFHRVIPGFMIQGGDPNTKKPDKSKWGMGGPGYTIKAEFSSRSHLRGIVSMARAMDPDSAGSQFYIVTTDSTFLDRQYTVFGQVIQGMDVADKIVNLPRDKNDCPHQEAKIIRINISE
jgi:peptidyl-prolyl cis-trans isomerase B (cyclophilin B)